MRTVVIALLAFACACANPPAADTEEDSMGLPTSREYTVDGSSPIQSSLLNKLQDAIIGMKFPSHWRWFSPSRGGVETNASFVGISGFDGGVWDNANGMTFKGVIPAGLPAGTRITDFGAIIQGTGGAQTVQVIFGMDTIAGGPNLSITGISAVNPPNARTRYNIGHSGFNGGTPIVTGDGDTLLFQAISHITNTGIIAIGIEIDRL